MTDSATLPESTCPACEEPLESGWTFCGRCGARLESRDVSGAEATDALAEVVRLPGADGEHADPTAVAPTPTAEVTTLHPGAPVTGRSRHVGWIVRGIAGAAVLALLGAGILNDLGTHHRLESTRTRLAATSSKLSVTTGKLTDTTKDLATRTSQRDSLQSELTSTNSELQGVRGSLSDAQNRVSIQAGQISALKTCLNGVATALSDASYGDYSGAIGALDAVQTACQDARSAF